MFLFQAFMVLLDTYDGDITAKKRQLVMEVNSDYLNTMTDRRAFVLLYYQENLTITDTIRSISDEYEKHGQYKFLKIDCGRFASHCQKRFRNAQMPKLVYYFQKSMVDYTVFTQSAGKAADFGPDSVKTFVYKFSVDAFQKFPSRDAMKQKFLQQNVSSYFVLEGKLTREIETALELFKTSALMVHFPSGENASFYAVRQGVKVVYQHALKPNAKELKTFVFRNQLELFPRITQSQMASLQQGAGASAVLIVDLNNEESVAFYELSKQFVSTTIQRGHELDIFFRFAWCELRDCPKYRRPNQLVVHEITQLEPEVYDVFGKGITKLERTLLQIVYDSMQEEIEKQAAEENITVEPDPKKHDDSWKKLL